MKRIAVIGAGMAGLTAASILTQAGLTVTIFDKGRVPGGRMATRRYGPLQFDHGAQYFTARGPEFSAWARSMKNSGLIACWDDAGYVGVPAMDAIGHAMAEKLTVYTDQEITLIERRKGRYGVWTAAGPAPTAENGEYDAIVIAIPAAQAIPILDAIELNFPTLANVQFAPCWALMLAFDRLIGFEQSYRRFDAGPISWIARNVSKPHREPARETFVIHAAPDWSHEFLEASESTVTEHLFAAFSQILQPKIAPIFTRAHRWRYALVESPAGVTCFWDGDAKIGLAGDWCIGARIEAAFDSGMALAKKIIQ